MPFDSFDKWNASSQKYSVGLQDECFLKGFFLDESICVPAGVSLKAVDKSVRNVWADPNCNYWIKSWDEKVKKGKS